MPRRNTRLESEGAEFLVLGQLLIQRIQAYKNYTNMPGYDLLAINPERNRSARISVKSRWSSGASQFIIKNFNCDFVVVVKLNRGLPYDAKVVKAPEFFVLPVGVVKKAPRSKGWSRVTFGSIRNFFAYEDRWDLIRTFLRRGKWHGAGILGLTIRSTSTHHKRRTG